MKLVTKTMKAVLASAIAILALLSCSKSKTIETTKDTTTLTGDTSVSDTVKASIDYDSYLKLESYLAQEQSDTSVFEAIDFNCAIIISPTDKQIDAMIKVNGEEDFATIADDMSYYQSEASQRIDSTGIRSISTDKQFIVLKGAQKTWTLDIRKANMPEWNIIFFNANKAPEIISAIDLSTQHVRDYFDIKR